MPLPCGLGGAVFLNMYRVCQVKLQTGIPAVLVPSKPKMWLCHKIVVPSGKAVKL